MEHLHPTKPGDVQANPNTLLIDCRTEVEYYFVGHPTDRHQHRVEHRAGLRGQPALRRRGAAHGGQRKEPVTLICRSGKRSMDAGPSSKSTASRTSATCSRASKANSTPSTTAAHRAAGACTGCPGARSDARVRGPTCRGRLRPAAIRLSMLDWPDPYRRWRAGSANASSMPASCSPAEPPELFPSHGLLDRHRATIWPSRSPIAFSCGYSAASCPSTAALGPCSGAPWHCRHSCCVGSARMSRATLRPPSFTCSAFSSVAANSPAARGGRNPPALRSQASGTALGLRLRRLTRRIPQPVCSEADFASSGALSHGTRQWPTRRLPVRSRPSAR